ncbi:MAG: putative ABC-class ATPase [Motiliproteus sp.]|jgi:predicted ABC-class ATPase
MQRLRARLQAIDGRNYKTYKTLQGRYQFDDFELWIDHVQGDPFADPSRIRLSVPASTAALPQSSYADPVHRLALEDFICRGLAQAIRRHVKGDRGSGHSGEVRIARCGQQVVRRDALIVAKGRIEARLGLALPASGRWIRAREALGMLFEEIPLLVQQSLRYSNMDPTALQRHLDCARDQSFLRDFLKQARLVAFVGDGAFLPRRSGIDDRPLNGPVIPFTSPVQLALEPILPRGGKIRGMGIPEGVTLIVGGGFNGKSTLLQALERGVYNHIPGDGREWVICDASAVKIRSEDGRSINRVDISPFINNLPLGKETRQFCTDNASGSTSQAANIIEALSCDARTLLIDEDTSASNFMLRDRRMQRLVALEQEPITPLIARIRALYQQQGVSTILVSGGSSAYFDVADRVILMDQYQARDASQQARALVTKAPEPLLMTCPAAIPTSSLSTTSTALSGLANLRLHLSARPRIRVFGCEQLQLGDYRIDLGRVEQLVEPGQLHAIGWLLALSAKDSANGSTPQSLLEALQRALRQLDSRGLDSLSPFYPEPHGGLSQPRLYELFAAVSRLRELRD